MRSITISTILVLALAQIASAAQSLTVNSQAINEITLKIGQSCTVEVVSDNSNPYTAYIGFDNNVVLGIFSHQQTMPEAGDLGAATEYSVPTFYGYFVTAAGSSPSPTAGVHFVFTYNPSTVGTTTLKLYDSTLTVLLDSVEITVLESVIGSAITYQGRLMESDGVAEGLYDLRFELYDSPSNGNLIGSTVEANDLDIVDGYFTVELDFGNPEAFYGEGRWLEIGVRPWNLNDPNGYTVLSPRQRIAATPHALGLRGVYVDSDEKVGIGTTTPSQNLIVQDARPRVGLVEDGGDAAVLEFHEQENQLRLQHWTDYGNTWNSDMMVLDGDTGNVGIGTTNPYQKLHIMEGGIAFTDSVNPIDERLLYLGITGIGPDRRGYKFSWRNDDGSLRSDAMILDRTGDVYFMGGNVGIGTTSPAVRLDVVGGTGESGISAVADLYGVHGKSNGDLYYGVYGESDSGYGGVRGKSIDGKGVVGESSLGYGVFGYSQSNRGVCGSSYSNWGVAGVSTNSYGVYGASTHSYAGYFSGDVYVVNYVSALYFIDRTPYPKDLATAYEAVMSMQRLPDGQYDENNKEVQLDHSMLSDFVRSEDGNRDLSATVSCHNEVLKDLIRKQKELDKAQTYIELLQKQNELLEARLVKLESLIAKKTLK